METSVLTLSVSAKTRDLLKKLAKETHRSETVLVTEAIERYVEVENWHIKEIKQAIKEADAGKFVTIKQKSQL
jgi:predicted transcriptional regulator